MIITRNGRCLFPLLRYRLETPCESSTPFRWNPDHYYVFGITVEALDKMKWKYRDGLWQPQFSVEKRSNSLESNAMRPLILRGCPIEPLDVFQCYEPSESPISGRIMAEQGLNFSKIKLSNRNTLARPMATARRPPALNLFCLSSFRRYEVVLHICDLNACAHVYPPHNNPSLSELLQNPFVRDSVQSFHFEETEFIAVTHYQNETITALKKSYNPHAKGFITFDDKCGTASCIPPSPDDRLKRRPRKRITALRMDVKEQQSETSDSELQASLALHSLSSSS